MYQPCTSTTVNHGEQRATAVKLFRVVSRSKAALPGTAESSGPGLITRRSQVQILPPPPMKCPETLGFRAFRIVGWRCVYRVSSTGSCGAKSLTWDFASSTR